MPRARALLPLAATLAIGAAGLLLGFQRTGSASRARPGQRAPFNPDAHLRGMRITGPTRFRSRSVHLVLILLLLIGAGIYAGYQVKFDQDARIRATALTMGDPDLGRRLAQRYGCAGCHNIPGVPGAQGMVGPALQGFAARVYIGGVATNSPDTLIQWIENPRSIDPKTAMPVTGISRAEARHVAAYLYTLR
jgi:cytochrome c2